MSQAKKRLEKVLGSTSYRNITQELKKDLYSDKDFMDLAQQLGVNDYYQELKERDNVSFKTYSELLLIRWAIEHPKKVSKENLSSAFKKTANLKGLQKVVDSAPYVFFPALSACCNPESTSPPLASPKSPNEPKHFFSDQKLPENKSQSPPFIHMDLKNGRHSAEDILRDQQDGSYLVRPSSQQENCYAISLKDKDGISHILVETVLTGTGVKHTLADKKEHFNSLKDLLDYYHVKQVFGLYRLQNIILPRQKGTLVQSPVTCAGPPESDINPVFIERFCEEIENHSNIALEQDIADRLELGQQFGYYKCSFRGINTSRSHRARWILEMWMQREGEKATIDKLEKTLGSLKEGKKIFKILKPFSKPW